VNLLHEKINTIRNILDKDSICFRNMEKFKYLGMTVRNHNHIHKGAKNKLNLEIATFNSQSYFLISYTKPKDKIYKIIILPVFSYECET
jgi:hypothetical protein